MTDPFTTPHPIDEATIQAFQRDGHAVVRGLASRDELAEVAPSIIAKGTELAWDTRPLDERDTYGKSFLQAFNLWKVDETIRQFVFSPRFAEVAARLLGVDGVRLYHDQSLFKEPGGGPTTWHQDQYYWPLDTDQTITMWMPLVDVPTEIGTMTFASGSHRVPELRGPGISEDSQEHFAEELGNRELSLTTYGALSAGDTTFHAGWIVHRAPENRTDTMRAVMTVIYVPDGTRILDDLSDAQEFDRQVWLGGRKTGALVDHRNNPVLWPSPAPDAG